MNEATEKTKTRILLVDDEEGIRRVLGITLQDAGYDVSTAENGEQAIDMFRRLAPEIVLTDIKMPGMDGIELLRRIKEERQDTEVIMITGHGDMDLAIKSLKLEATDFVTKPIHDDVLGIALRRAHERIWMRGQIRAYTENLEKLVAEKSARLVSLERLTALGQAVDGLSSAMRNIAENFEGGLDYFNEMPCLVSIHSRDLKVVGVNQRYRDHIGDRIGADSWDIYKKKPDGGKKCPVQATFASGEGVRSRETIVLPDGGEEPVIVHTAPIRNSKNELELVIEIAANISEVSRLQKELQATRQRYQLLFNEAPCYITVQDREFRITAANRRFREDFGEQIGTHCYRALMARQAPCEQCPVAETFQDGHSHNQEMAVTAGSGRQYNVLAWTAPIRNASGEITQVMEMSTNITQIRRLQDHLTSLGLMVGSISHGIKGVLTGLDAGIYLLGTGFAKRNKQQSEEGLELVKMMAERIRKVVLDILYYAKNRSLTVRSIHVKDLIRELLLVVKPKTEKHGIDFVLDCDSMEEPFEADEMALRLALVNILENAVEACREDASGRDHRIELTVAGDAETIDFRIRDNGVGMTPEAQRHLFTLFYSSKGHLGTGLGLFLAKQIVDQHGGSIGFESESGHGSVFHVHLPRVLPFHVKNGYDDFEPTG